ncbi:Protein MtfA [Thalassocella blandensis]|nr:Protein MtfA [Thalassocella blandensis]
MTLIKKILTWLFCEKPPDLPAWQPLWSDFLQKKVAFYRALNAADRDIFHRRVLLFLYATAVESSDGDVTDNDRLLVAASAIIPVWGFPNWHYLNLQSVYLLPQAFNSELEFGKPDSCITGMVGTGQLSGKLVLSKPHLYYGFENSRDKQNVGIHEFVHLIDMADGECDGFPERLKDYAFSIPWFELVRSKIDAIDIGQSNINDYAATNRQEFFAVASEYFFERPEMLEAKHPRLYQSLCEFYRQDAESIKKGLSRVQLDPCVCGSGKPLNQCCDVPVSGLVK